MTALLLFALLLAVLIGACVEFHWLRQTVRERSDQLTAELHTVEAVLAEHREALDGLKSGSEASDAAYTAFFRSLEARQKEIHKTVCPPVDIVSNTESQLSKAMEEGIMNLMQYSAGKTSGGVEVGLG